MDEASVKLRDLARRHGEMAIGVLAEIAEDGEAKASARVMAASKLLERGFGMPERRVEIDETVTIIDKTAAHLDAMRQLAERNRLAELTSPPRRTIEGSAVRLPAPRSEFEE